MSLHVLITSQVLSGIFSNFQFRGLIYIFLVFYVLQKPFNFLERKLWSSWGGLGGTVEEPKASVAGMLGKEIPEGPQPQIPEFLPNCFSSLSPNA